MAHIVWLGHRTWSLQWTKGPLSVARGGAWCLKRKPEHEFGINFVASHVLAFRIQAIVGEWVDGVFVCCFLLRFRSWTLDKLPDRTGLYLVAGIEAGWRHQQCYPLCSHIECTSWVNKTQSDDLPPGLLNV